MLKCCRREHCSADADVAAKAAPSHGASTDQRAVGTQQTGHDARPSRELETCRSVELLLCRLEDLRAVAERHRTGDHGKTQVEQAGDGRDGAPDELSPAPTPLRRPPPGWA